LKADTGPGAARRSTTTVPRHLAHSHQPMDPASRTAHLALAGVDGRLLLSHRSRRPGEDRKPPRPPFRPPGGTESVSQRQMVQARGEHRQRAADGPLRRPLGRQRWLGPVNSFRTGGFDWPMWPRQAPRVVMRPHFRKTR